MSGERLHGPDPSAIAAAAEALRRGRAVAFPTETVYGLGADAFNEEAVREVFRLKGRPANNPLIVHVADEAMAMGRHGGSWDHGGRAGPSPRAVVREWPPDAAALARAFWPGPLTIVLPKAQRVPPAVTGGGPNVAVRCPDHPVALALLRAFGGPLVGPSANPSGQTSPTTADHVRESFGDAVLVLDGGPCRVGIESTVLSLAGGAARLLRPGVVSAEQIAAVLGRPVETAGAAGGGAGGGPLESPGMLERHYAPRARAVTFDDAQWERVERLMAAQRRVAVLTPRDRRVPAPHLRLAMPAAPEAYAARLYAALREADARGATLIAIESPSGVSALWDSIRDRLRRAAPPLGAVPAG